ncbi:MAG: hypothetical protein ACAI44_14295 [Candidatus Sericytochromatia bacterium]
MLQFDIVLQKQNLGAHQQVHPAMYMPSHGEFLVELLARHGLKPGLSFGLDDFAPCAGVLNQSEAEILIVCGADQHFSQAFYQGWQQVQRAYAYRVLILSEPVFSPLAFYLDPQHNAEANHIRFLEAFAPDCVLYLSRYDLLASERRFGPAFARGLYSLADPLLLQEPVRAWEAKEHTLLYLGKPDAWVHSRAQASAMTRQQQFDFFVGQTRMPFAWSFRQFSFRQCYGVANQFRFQLQPRSGYAFHSARTIQSALVGSIPVLLLHHDELPILAEEAPFARPDHNLLVGLEGEFDILLDKLRDQDLCRQIHRHLPELLEGGTISQGVQFLAEKLKTVGGGSPYPAA